MDRKIRKLSPALQEIAKNEFGETAELLETCITSLKAWLEKSSHIKARTDDQFLASFLRSCKFSLEETKRKLEDFYSIRSEAPELMTNRDPQNVKAVIELGFQIIVSDEDSTNSRILLVRAGCYDPSIFQIQDLLKVVVMVLDYQINEDDKFIICGHVSNENTN